MKPEFNPLRLVQLDLHGHSQRFTIGEIRPLAAVLEAREVLETTPVLTAPRADGVFVFRTSHFSLYNVMQGTLDGEPWLASFCAVCNAGMSFSPVVNGRVLEFYGAGFYDAMILLADRQTGSYWDHLTGECVHGELEGTTLRQIAVLTHSTAGQTRRLYPEARYVVSTLNAERAPLDELAEGLRVASDPQWFPQILGSLDVEDARLPRFEMGLGVWANDAARFYPFRTLNAQNNVVFDEFDGRRLLIYVDPETMHPSALFTEAESAAWRGETLQLGTGQSLRGGGLYQRDEVVPIQRPLQLFQRWYGFSLTFPGCELYPSYRKARAATQG